MTGYSTHLLLATLTLSLSCTGPSSGPVEESTAGDLYRITVDSTDLRHLKVEALLDLSKDTLSMDWPAAASVERGWAQFVEDLTVTDMADSAIALTYIDKAKWHLSRSAKRVKVTYTLNVTHDHMEWSEGGHSASAYVVNNVVYLIGAALFIAQPSDLERGSIHAAQIVFNLPAGYNIAVPWTPVPDKIHTFDVGSTYELVRSAMLIGDIRTGSVEVADMRVEIASSDDFAAIIPIFSPIYESVVPAAQNFFADAKAGSYTVIANKAPRTPEFEPYFSGEALHRSMSFISPIIPTDEYMPLFQYVLTHEYVHNWNGIAIQAAEEGLESWFTEGFTDHVALCILHQEGFLPQELLLNGFAVPGYSVGWGENVKKYLAVAGMLSLREAGLAKEDNYDLVYSGGSVFALVLDIEIRSATAGKIGVRELMRELNERFGSDSRRSLKYEDIKILASEMAKTDLNHLFDAYVTGTKVLPVAEYLRKAGLIITSQGGEHQVISVDPKATPNEKAVLQGILTR